MIRWFFAGLLATVGVNNVRAADVPASVARTILTESGVKGGLVVHVGCGDGKLTAALRANDAYRVHGLDTKSENVAAARRHIQSLGLYGQVSVDRWDGERLPYVDNLVNLIVAAELDAAAMAEAMHVLCPEGVVLVGSGGKWTKTVKPWPQEMDAWTHFRHGADNNPVARDTLVGPPRRLQWCCEPLWLRSHAFTSSFCAMVSARGRVFYILDEAPTGIAQDAVPEQWTLVARDAFNGVLLWKRPMSLWGAKAWKKPQLRAIPHPARECLVADGDRVFVTLGYQSAVSVLDAATGEELAVCEATAGTQEIRCESGVLLVNQGGKRLLAFDARDARPLWRIDAQMGSLTAHDGRVFYYDKKQKALVCHRVTDGKPDWKTIIRPPGVVLAHGDCVLLGIGHNLQAVSVETGETLWTAKQAARAGRPFVAQQTVWIMSADDKHIIGLDLTTGEPCADIETSAFYSAGHHPRCYPAKATENYLITQNRGAEFFSLTGGEHCQNDWVRGACTYGVMPCNGMLYVPPHRLLLLGHEDHAEATLADLLQELVRPDHRAWLLGDRLVRDGGQRGLPLDPALVQQAVFALVCRQ